MSMINATFLIAAWVMLAFPSAAATLPNIVIVLADDLGLADLERFETPAIDRLAAEGIVFTNAYAGSALCAPSRAALLFGDHTGHVEPRGNRAMRLTHERTTLAEALREAGYATGLFGKWGFGSWDRPSTWPERYGWEKYLAYLGHDDAQDHTPEFLWENGERRDLSGEYAPDVFDEAALQFTERHQGQPFLLYAASALPHAPLEVPGIEGDDQAIFAGMVQRLDQTVGAIIAELEKLGLAQRTLVIVTSDNGATESGGDLRGEKGTLYEGGIRVPLIAWWPGTIAPGERDALVAGWDIYATAAALAGLRAPDAGVSLLSEPPVDRPLYWELHQVMTAQAVRWDHWKAIRRAPNAPVQLYDLLADPAETMDVASAHPELVEHAIAVMEAAHEPNPDWPVADWTWRRQAEAWWAAFGNWAYGSAGQGRWYGQVLIWLRETLR